MFLSLFLKGCLIGFSIAMPVGPIGLLCIRNTLALGFLGGLFSGLGAAVADALFGCIASFGVATIIALIEKYHLWVHTIGALVLMAIGVHIVRTAKKSTSHISIDSTQAVQGLTYAFFSTFLLTLVNPLTILSYAAVYASLSPDVVQMPTCTSALLMASGIFVGSTLWWLILSAFTTYIKSKLDAKYMVRINTLSGFFLILLGIGTWLAALL